MNWSRSARLCTFERAAQAAENNAAGFLVCRLRHLVVDVENELRQLIVPVDVAEGGRRRRGSAGTSVGFGLKRSSESSRAGRKMRSAGKRSPMRWVSPSMPG